MIVALALGVIVALVGLARGGSIEPLAATRFRYVALLSAALAVQITFDVWSPGWLSGAAALALLLSTHMAVVTFLFANRRLPGMRLAAVGLALNVIAIASNGAMPVSERALEIAGVEHAADMGIKHELLTGDTVFPWLTDVIPLPKTMQVISVGDVVLAVGIGRFIYARVTTQRRPHEAEEPS